VYLLRRFEEYLGIVEFFGHRFGEAEGRSIVPRGWWRGRGVWTDNCVGWECGVGRGEGVGERGGGCEEGCGGVGYEAAERERASTMGRDRKNKQKEKKGFGMRVGVWG